MRGSSRAAALIEDIIGRPIDGFVAPAWLYGPGAIEALADCASRSPKIICASGRRRPATSCHAAR